MGLRFRQFQSSKAAFGGFYMGFTWPPPGFLLGLESWKFENLGMAVLLSFLAVAWLFRGVYSASRFYRVIWVVL